MFTTDYCIIKGGFWWARSPRFDDHHAKDSYTTGLVSARLGKLFSDARVLGPHRLGFALALGHTALVITKILRLDDAAESWS